MHFLTKDNTVKLQKHKTEIQNNQALKSHFTNGTKKTGDNTDPSHHDRDCSNKFRRKSEDHKEATFTTAKLSRTKKPMQAYQTQNIAITIINIYQGGP